MSVLLVNANSLSIPLADGCVQTCVTSPPYWGLRDYGTAKWEGGDPECDHNPQRPDGGERADRTLPLGRGGMYKGVCGKCGALRLDNQLGLEDTPELYVERMVQVFREVRRVLRDDGVVFLNLGDSYYGSNQGRMADGTQVGGTKQMTNKGSVTIGGGVQRVKPCGTSDKEPEGCQDRGCLCESLCDACRKAYLIGRFHNGIQPAPMQFVLPCETNPAHTVLHSDHLPTLDSSHQADHNETAIPDPVHLLDHEGEQPPVSQVSTIDESSQPHPADFHQSGMPSACPLCGKPFERDAQVSSHKSDGFVEQPSHIQDNELHADRQVRHNQCKGKACEYYVENVSYPHYTTAYHLKPKDLVGIPWRVAFALQADGWYLRSDIIWAKPNPMPESVTDRPTKAHEYVFLLSKNARYYYDADAIREAQDPASLERLKRGWNGDGNRGYPNGPQNHIRDYMGKSDDEIAMLPGRNKRTVWTINTYSYSGAHFATYPPALVEPCIKAGSRTGDLVLDPFAGSGTTLMVARSLERDAVGLDLSYTYLHEQARTRLELDKLEAWTNGRKDGAVIHDLPLFQELP